jgi:hypothetical protein
MSTWPRYGKPIHWGLVVVVLLVIAGMALLVLGSWELSDGLNGIVVDHTNPFYHFSEATASQEVTDGIIYLALGVACFVAFAVLFFSKRGTLFPQPEHSRRG